MKIKTLTALLFLLPLLAFAQYDETAKIHLDELAAAVKTDQGIAISFDLKVSKIQSKTSDFEEQGTLLLKNNAHKLDLAGTETYGDGENQWLYMTDENEVTIQPLEEDELTPASIFTIYEKGYRFRTLEEGEGKVVVELSPTDKSSVYVRITLFINKTNKQLDAFTTQGKNGMITSINITEWNEGNIDDAELIFDAKRYPDVEIIDLR